MDSMLPWIPCNEFVVNILLPWILCHEFCPRHLFVAQAEHGHKEATRYLLEKGADVTATDSLGNSALSVAKTPSLVSILQGNPQPSNMRRWYGDGGM